MSSQYSTDDSDTIYKVVINPEEQYSIWPEHKENPLGWSDAGRVGPKADCLAFIKEVWTDMRPLTLRKKMADMAENPLPLAPEPAPRNEMGLVDRLCDGQHPILLSLDPNATLNHFREAVENGYLRFTFTDTRPGTELGVRLDRSACNLDQANLVDGRGTARLVGNLSLDYTRVRCVVDIDLETLAGYGRLERIRA